MNPAKFCYRKPRLDDMSFIDKHLSDVNIF